MLSHRAIIRKAHTRNTLACRHSLVTDQTKVGVERDKRVRGSNVFYRERVQIIGQDRAKTERLLLVHQNGAVQRRHAREIPAARSAAERADNHLIRTPVKLVFVHRFQYVLVTCEHKRMSLLLNTNERIIRTADELKTNRR